MSTSNNTIATTNSVAVKAQSTTVSSENTTQSRRLWETRDMWQVIFDHTVTLIVLALKGDKLPDEPRKGYAFGKATDKDGKTLKLKVSEDQPHMVGYAVSLLAGFGSYATKKANKALLEAGLQNEVLGDAKARMSVAEQLVIACNFTKTNAAERISKADAKQGRALVLAVATALNSVKGANKKAKTTPKGVEKKSTSKAKKAA